ncbi:30S ribosomal protein S8 [Candidatus Parcubacteria bacterium]|nr:MAG: 30S ribosomal protein S8 [Candidatus Parcubacteria bacterium]
MDALSDFFIRIKNGYRAKRATVIVPHSKLKAEVARVLQSRGYIGEIEKKGRKVRKFLELELRYPNGEPALESVKLISKPSRKLYMKKGEIRPIRQGFGLLVISTSRGIMSGEEARKAGLGGMAIAEIW